MPRLVVAVDFHVSAGDVAGLIDAINMANGTAGSNRITLEAGVYTLRDVNNDTDGPNGLPNITNVLTISSSGGTAVLERAADAPSFRILHVGSSGLALFNVTIRGGSANKGGGLFNRGRITFLFSSTVNGNQASQGGGIFNNNNGGFLPGELVLFDSTIDRNGASQGGGGIFNQGGLSISNSTIRMNRNDTFGGGGVLNDRGRLTITNSTISTNTSGAGFGGQGGGGIFNLRDSTLTITNSTISGNRVPTGNGRGGGIRNAATLNLNNVTITDNTAQIAGGGISNFGSGTVNLQNTIIAGNFDLGGTFSRSPDCHGTLTSQGFNLIGNTGSLQTSTPPPPPACVIVPPDAPVDQVGTEFSGIKPRLAPLALDPLSLTGTETRAPEPGSPVIDAGNPAEPGSGGTACEATDQRRFGRPVDGNEDGIAICDIGAFEFGAIPQEISFQVGVSPTPAYAGTRDTYISEDQPTTNFCSLPTLRVDGNDPPGTGRELRTLLQWDLSAIPAGSEVTSATITINVTNPTGGTYELYRISSPWEECQVTWNTRPSREMTVRGPVGPASTGTHTITLNNDDVALVQSWVDGSTPNYGIMIVGSDVPDGLAFDASEASPASNRPRLTITFD